MRKKYFLTAFILFSLVFSVPSELFDTPTALSFEQGEYNIHFTVYQGGGILLKGGLGISERIHLGIMEFVDGLIGKDENKWQIPGIFGKIVFSSCDPLALNVAAGYDSFYNGSFTEYVDKSYGPFISLSKGFLLVAEDPHLFSFGIRYPIVKNKDGRPELFVSQYINLGPVFSYAVEMHDITFNKKAKYSLINNHIAEIRFGEFLYFQFIFQIALSTGREEYISSKSKAYFSRNIRLGYSNYF
jgi:hypothetical protein